VRIVWNALMHNKLKSILPGMQEPSIPPRTRFCPDDAVLAAFYEGTAEPPTRERILAHLAACAHCRTRFGALARLDLLPDSDPPDALLAKAKRQVGDRLAPLPGSTVKRLLPLIAAAAMLFLAVGLFVLDSARESGHAAPDSGGSHELRRPASYAQRLDLQVPADSSVVGPGPLEVQWSAVEGSLHYEILLMNDYGDTVLRERVAGDRLRAELETALEGGAGYYLRVTARLDDGRIVSSPSVSFEVAALRDGEN
jgi:hypothetical protein